MALTRVTKTVISDGAIDTSKLGNNSILSRHVADGAITVAKLSSEASVTALETRINANLNQNKTLKEYYQWNQLWINESYRILKNTGSIYLLSHWKYSGMYQNLLASTFKIQSRIIWRNQSSNDRSISWINETSDIWFATKTDDFLFKQLPVGTSTIEHLNSSVLESNLWLDIPRITNEGGHYPQKLFNKIIGLSSFKLNWVLDPFMGIGDVGWSCKKKGRRFIGFETDKDQMLLAMKRVDNC